MRNHRICSRRHVQGEAAPLRVRHSARNLTDGGGLILVRRLWDNLGLGSWIDRRTQGLAGFFRPSLMVEAWVVLLLYGGRVLDDLPLLDRRGIRRLFGWTGLPDHHPDLRSAGQGGLAQSRRTDLGVGRESRQVVSGLRTLRTCSPSLPDIMD